MLLLFGQSNLIAHFDRDSTLSDNEVILVRREETIRDSHWIQSDTIHSQQSNERAYSIGDGVCDGMS